MRIILNIFLTGTMSATQGRLLLFLISVVKCCQKLFLESIFFEFDVDHDNGLSNKELVALMVCFFFF